MPILLNIRLIQIKRELNSAGLGVLIIPGIFLFLIYASYSIFLKTTDAYYLTAFLFFVCLSFQVKRKDKVFVYTHLQNPYREIYLEYVALIFPFAVTCLLTDNWIMLPILLISLWLVPLLKYTTKQKTYFKNISKIIPAYNFEWISGFRKSFLLLILLYLLSVAFSWFRILPLFLLWFITVTICSFYTECEPLVILKEGNFSSKEFLWKKLLRHSKYLTLIYTPILIINILFNPEYWLLILLFIPIQLSLLCLAICLKYSTYEPNTNSIGNSILFSVISIGSIIPFLLPLPLLMAVNAFGKAKRNLNTYLND